MRTGIYVNNIPDKFHSEPIWTDGDQAFEAVAQHEKQEEQDG